MILLINKIMNKQEMLKDLIKAEFSRLIDDDKSMVDVNPMKEIDDTLNRGYKINGMATKHREYDFVLTMKDYMERPPQPDLSTASLSGISDVSTPLPFLSMPHFPVSQQMPQFPNYQQSIQTQFVPLPHQQINSVPVNTSNSQTQFVPTQPLNISSLLPSTFISKSSQSSLSFPQFPSMNLPPVVSLPQVSQMSQPTASAQQNTFFYPPMLQPIASDHKSLEMPKIQIPTPMKESSIRDDDTSVPNLSHNLSSMLGIAPREEFIFPPVSPDIRDYQPYVNDGDEVYDYDYDYDYGSEYEYVEDEEDN
jgi:hypothetical protein